MAGTTSHLLFIFFVLCLSSTPLSTTSFRKDRKQLSVEDFGAIGDGKTDASQAFLRAWSKACQSSDVHTTIYVPRKKFFLGSVDFQGPYGSILVSPQYLEMGFAEDWIRFIDVHGLSIIGGYLDGRGNNYGGVKRIRKNSLSVYGSKNVVIRNLTSIDAKLYHVVIHSCENIKIEGVKIYAPNDSPNTDGIHVQNALNVHLLRTAIKTGDDCISVGPGTRNLRINRIACGPGHGISTIGSLGKGLEEEGVSNMTVTNAVDIKLTYQHQPAESVCENVLGAAHGEIAPPSCL
ncbi:hypothetical protein MKW92_051139 [Papaver armeniacum]|nr:hypothetical protein MKW92_051139 [Papaver armeniacum]